MLLDLLYNLFLDLHDIIITIINFIRILIINIRRRLDYKYYIYYYKD